ncbi:MAG: hypothetical protein WC700_04550 [Gemmatimonadaceae bacterium]|jgi:hypothetical protein
MSLPSAPFRLPQFLPYAALLVTAIGCASSSKSDVDVEQTAALVARAVGPELKATDSVRVDVYLDATVSMSGFTVDGTSNYSKFLNDLESSLSNGWKRVDVHYWKFGGTAREIARPEFLQARTPTFYSERGFNEVTSIDQAVGCQRGPRMGVVITDLFQQAGDVNAIVARIKAKCLAENVAVGILAVKSQFDGRVFDARVPPFAYRAVGPDTAAYRAFYALVFGQPNQFDALVQAMERLPFVSARNFALVSPYVVRHYDVVMSKGRDAKDVNLNKAAGPYAFNFAVRKGGTGGTLIADVTLTPNASSPPATLARAELMAFRRATGRQAAGDGPPSRDLELKQLTAQGNKAHLEIALDITDPPGRYEYIVELRAASVNGFGVPAFVHALSSEDPTPTRDPNKTLNLESFIMNLRQAATSQHQPVLASWLISVNKH